MKSEKLQQLQLVFGRKEQLKFTGEEEFFEVLGILCKPERLVEIIGRKRDGLQMYDNEGIIIGNSGDEEDKDVLDIIEQGGFGGSGINSFIIVCPPCYVYPNAFACLIKNAEKTCGISCAEYVRYLMKYFGAYMHREPGEIDKVRVNLPSESEMKELIASHGFEHCLSSFEKGLSA